MDQYEKLPINKVGDRYILRSRCCVAKITTTEFICIECKKSPCEIIIFSEKITDKIDMYYK